MRWIKEHWFGLLMSIFVLFVVLYFIIILVSPRYDLQRRGFIPCTEELAQNISACQENKLTCAMGAIWRNNLCDLRVIVQGFSAWLEGKQARPWSNYWFEPELLSDRPGNDDPDLAEFYRQHPDLQAEMNELKRLEQEQYQNDQPKE